MWARAAVVLTEGAVCSKLQLSSQDVDAGPQVRAMAPRSAMDERNLTLSPNGTDRDVQASVLQPGPPDIPDWCRPDAGGPQHEWEEPGKGAPYATIMHLGRPHTGTGTWDTSQHPSVSQGPHSEPSLPYQRRCGRRAWTTERKKSQHFSSLLIQFFTWSDLNIYGRRCR